MNGIRQVQELNKRELESVVPPSASWHADYRHTAFIYIGGLPPTLTEGDVITIFSQYGNPVYINLVRDKETGKSRGFCFLKYEDQRSCDLAVDNLGGAPVMERVLRVDHTEYKVKEGEVLRDNTSGDGEGGASDGEVRGGEQGKEKKKEDVGRRRPMLADERELLELERNHDDDDPMKEYLVQQKKEEVEEAVARWEKENNDNSTAKSRQHRHHHRHHHRHRSHKESDDRHRDDHHREKRHRDRSERARSSDSDDRSHRRRHHRR